jgi:hypothetical protein
MILQARGIAHIQSNNDVRPGHKSGISARHILTGWNGLANAKAFRTGYKRGFP